MKNRLVLCSVLFSLVADIFAMPARWELKPQNFSSLTYMGAGMFEAMTANGKKMINSKGEDIIAKPYDLIYGFYGGMAVVADKEKHLVGFLSDAGVFTPVEGTFTLIEGMEFVSDGMLPALDSNGRCGYVRVKGNPLGFDGRWKRVTPFSEGYASVYPKDKDYALINLQGVPCQFNLGGVGRVCDGAGVFNGSAIIWDRNGKSYVFSIQTNKTERSQRDYEIGDRDYMGNLPVVTGRPRQIPYEKIEIEETPVTSMMGNGLYGFMSSQAPVRTILPAQFQKVEKVLDGLAVVTTTDKRMGILRFDLASKGFQLEASTEKGIFSTKRIPACSFTLTSAPADVNVSELNVQLIDSHQHSIASTIQGNVVGFTYKPEGKYKANSETSETFAVGIMQEDLVLWKDSITLNFKKAPLSPLTCSIAVPSLTANDKDLVPVTVTVTNPNDEDVQTAVSIMGSSSLVAKTETVTVPELGKRSVTTYFKVPRTVRNQYVTAKTSKGGEARRNIEELKGFYN